MSPQQVKSASEIFLLPLSDEGAPEIPGGYIYLPPPTQPPYSIRFLIEGTSSICRQGSLWVNLPESGETFDRSKFREFKYAASYGSERSIDPVKAQTGF